MTRILYASENQHAGMKNGVTTAVSNMQRALGLVEGEDYVYVCPSNPAKPAPPHVRELPAYSLSSKWIPEWVATIDEGYRFAIPASAPLAGPLINAQLTNWMRSTGPYIVHIQGTQLVSDHVAQACVKLGIPYGLTLHTYDKQYLDDRVHLKPLREMMKRSQAKRSIWIANHATWVSCASTWYEKRFRKFTGFQGKIIIMPSIVWPFDVLSEPELDHLESQFRQSELPSATSSRPLIGCFGRKSPEKNLEFAVGVMSQLKELYQAHRDTLPLLVFIGPEAKCYDAKLLQLARSLGVEHDIILLGRKDNHDLIKLAQACGVLIFPSQTETQGLVRVEAQLAQAVPLVPIDTALAENLDDDSLILPMDPQIWANRLYELYHDARQRHVIATHQRKVALVQNDPHAYAERLRALYARISPSP